MPAAYPCQHFQPFVINWSANLLPRSKYEFAKKKFDGKRFLTKFKWKTITAFVQTATNVLVDHNFVHAQVWVLVMLCVLCVTPHIPFIVILSLISSSCSHQKTFLHHRIKNSLKCLLCYPQTRHMLALLLSPSLFHSRFVARGVGLAITV